MDMWQEEAARWWAQATDGQRQALLGTVRAWAHEVGDNWALDPLASRFWFRALSEELGARGDFPLDVTMRAEWRRLPDRTKASWVQVLGEEFEPGSRGAQAARAVGLAMAPPPFRSLTDSDQVYLLRQIANEVETYLEHDPRWYSRATPAYRDLAHSIRQVEKLTTPTGIEHSDLRWSHMSPSARDGVLGDIAQFARSVARGEEISPPVQRELLALARSAEKIIAPERSMVRD